VSLYYFFSSIEALLEVLYQRALNKMIGELGEIPEASEWRKSYVEKGKVTAALHTQAKKAVLFYLESVIEQTERDNGAIHSTSATALSGIF